MRKYIVFVLTIIFFGCLVTNGLAGERNSWRVDGKLISDGDSQSMVRSLAGKPDWKDVRTIEEEFTHDEKVVNVWTYEQKDEIYEIFFHDDVVQKIVWERK